MTSAHLVWNVDPVLVRFGGVEVRSYGLLFGVAIVTTLLVGRARARAAGLPDAIVHRAIPWAVGGALLGGHLGHLLFYAPASISRDRLMLVAIWRGGMSSHGAAIGLVAASALFARRYRLALLWLLDIASPAAALGVGWIRLGNFVNSEIFGRPSDVPWAIVFARVDGVPRHPVQLYDLLIGPTTYLVQRAAERRGLAPTGSGLVTGIALTVYFTLRILVEEYKALLDEPLRGLGMLQAIERATGLQIHSGQWLSVLPVLAGIALIARALKAHGSRG